MWSLLKKGILRTHDQWGMKISKKPVVMVLLKNGPISFSLTAAPDETVSLETLRKAEFIMQELQAVFITSNCEVISISAEDQEGWILHCFIVSHFPHKLLIQNHSGKSLFQDELKFSKTLPHVLFPLVLGYKYTRIHGCIWESLVIWLPVVLFRLNLCEDTQNP